ncbi:hypothetical protein [Bauldia sp.]|uniref:hypothetical protein n=1 Tax=Bauldia sp. TaxID=2575872 RepID=UPI003BACA27F
MRSALVAVTIIAFPPIAVAEDPGLCADPDLFGHDRQVVSLDHGTDGATAGDTRTGRITLHTAAGAEAVEAMWHTTVLKRSDEGNDAYMGEYAFEDEHGVLFGRFIHGAKFDFHQIDHRPQSLDVAILGGLGAYQNATGLIELDLTAEPIAYTFSVACQ